MFPEEEQFAMSYSVLNLTENLFLRTVYMKDLHENPSKSSGIKAVIPDVEKNEIIELEDHKEDIEKRKSFKNLNFHFEKTKKNEPLLARGLFLLKKYF